MMYSSETIMCECVRVCAWVHAWVCVCVLFFSVVDKLPLMMMYKVKKFYQSHLYGNQVTKPFFFI